MKKSQVLRNYLASEGIEKTPAEAKFILKKINKVFGISYEEYIFVKDLEEEGEEGYAREAKKRDISVKEYREICSFLHYVGEKKFGF